MSEPRAVQGADAPLIAVPNVSEGRRADAIAELESAFTRGGAVLLDTHSDADHDRSVFTLAGRVASLTEAMTSGARAAISLIDMRSQEGLHPRIGALDVCPIVFTSPAEQAEAVEIARAVAIALGDLDLPVFLYGELAPEPERRERAYFRRGGIPALAERLASGELRPDHGPAAAHPTAGAVLVTARPPLVAFNLELDTSNAEVARAIASELRESGGGLPGVRAIGLTLATGSGRAQVSTNVHDPFTVPLALVVERTTEIAVRHGARPVAAELVGLAPAAALDGYPEEVPIPGFDPEKHLLESRLAALSGAPAGPAPEETAGR